MENTIKKAAKNALEALESLQHQIGDVLEDAPDDMKEVQKTMQHSLIKIQEKLKTSMDKGESVADDAQLQAHLGIMEARDKLEESKVVIQSYIDNTSGKSESLMDTLELKAHLARMDAEDLWAERGHELTDLFNTSRETMSDLAGKAAGELQEQLHKWGVESPKDK